MKSKRTYRIEACVESLEQAELAVTNGADQIELCSSLHLDGLSPSMKLVERCLASLPVLVKVMLRPLPGDFKLSETIFHKIHQEVRQLKNQGVKEVVFGFLNDKQVLDIEAIKRVADLVYPMDITIHKAIDRSLEPLKDIERLKSIRGIKSILSSGSAPTALLGASRLTEMQAIASNEIQIIGAGKITSTNLNQIHEALGLSCYHGRKITG